MGKHDVGCYTQKGALAKLQRADPQTNHIFANLCHLWKKKKKLGIFEGEKPRESTPCTPSEHRRVLCYCYRLVRSGGEKFYLSPMSLP